MKMYNMGLRTIIILLVVLYSLLRPSSLEYYVDSDSNCLKQNLSYGIKYLCPKENVEIGLFISSANKVSLYCKNVSRPFVDKEILPRLNLTEYFLFSLIGCNLNVSFYEILSKFNMNKVKYLAYVPSSILGDVGTTNVTKEMFEHMESIEYLYFNRGMLNLNVDFLDNTPNLRKLSLKNNSLTHITNYFNHVPKLKYLNLSENQIDFIPDGVFEDLENLVELNASYNRLTSITKNTFNGLKSLQELWLENNYIENIEEESFAAMHKLVNISLHFNNIQETHSHLFKNNKLLENIKLGHNNISVLPDYLFANLTSLQTIDLSFNNLRGILEHTFSNCCKLRKLTLEANRLPIISEKTFFNLTSLENIKLDHNPNLVLPDYLFANLTSLQTIDLSFNNLRGIPEHTFSNCCKLRKLTLEANRLSTIPEKTFLNLTSLNMLDISNNALETLSDQLFSSLDNLEVLNVSNNQLTALDSDVFHKMEKLRFLDLSRNYIGFIHLLAFRGLYSLAYLDLSDNQLNGSDHIGYKTSFHECQNLRKLRLRNNKIRDYNYILRNIYYGPIEIDLSSNLIKDLKVRDFIFPIDFYLEVNLRHNEVQYVNFPAGGRPSHEPLFGDSIIYLDDNPIVCDCSNINLTRYNNDEMTYIKNIVIKQYKLTCSDNKNILVKDLKPNQIGCPVLQGCPSQCACTYKPYNAAVIVDCSFNNLTSYPDFSFNDTKYQQTILNLSGNHLNAGPVENSNYENVTFLDLSQNHISEMTWIPPNIKELNLKGNHLRKLDSHFLNLLKNRTSLEQINLENNPWDCNCDALDFQKFLILYHVKVDSSNVYCHNSTTKIVTLSDLCKTSALITVLLPIVFTVLLCFTVALALYYRYQREIKIYLYAQNACLWLVTEEEMDKDKTYDVFISYANQDENFVLEHLLPELEHGQTPFKVCVHTRDWVPGEFIITQIINSVKDSRRTLVVLSNNFVDSMWGRLEFRTAHTEAITEGRARVIVVIYGDLNEDKLDDELKCYIKTHTYVKWGDKYFWNKLKYALPHSRQHVKMVVQTDEEFDLITTPASPKNTSTSLVTSDISL